MRSLLLVLALWVPAHGGWAEITPEAAPPLPDVSLPFPVGETLRYTIYWGWIAVGESVATTEWVQVEGDWLLLIQFQTRSNGVLSKLYPVDDLVQSWVDPETLRPMILRMELSQGDRTRDETTRFDWERLQAEYVRVREDREDEVKTYEIPPGVRDIVSFMYFLRKATFEPKTSYDYKVMSDEKVYDLTINTDKEQSVKLDAYGKVPSLRMEPLAEFDGAIIRRGKMKVWLTTEGRQVISKIWVDTPFANVRLLLKSVEGPGADGLADRGTRTGDEISAVDRRPVIRFPSSRSCALLSPAVPQDLW